VNQLKGFQIVSRENFQKVGGYDELLSGYAAGGDTELEERLRFLRLDMVPLAWSEKAQDLLKSYASTKKHRAIAIRPSPLWLQVYSGAKSEAEAERQVLERCNASGQSAYPCFLYAVDDLVVLPKRRTEPRL